MILSLPQVVYNRFQPFAKAKMFRQSVSVLEFLSDLTSLSLINLDLLQHHREDPGGQMNLVTATRGSLDNDRRRVQPV